MLMAGLINSLTRQYGTPPAVPVDTDVIVTEYGPSPPKLELTASTVKATADAGVAAPPPPPPVKPGVNTDDSEFGNK